MTYNVFGGMLNLAQSINLPPSVSDRNSAQILLLILPRCTRTVLFCVCKVSLHTFDIMPPKSLLSIIIVIIITHCRSYRGRVFTIIVQMLSIGGKGTTTQSKCVH